MKQAVDVIIIGGGIGGLMTAYRIKSLDRSKKVIILEKGNTIDKRDCPAQNGKVCVHCKTCSITSGYAGAGAFSDGKFNLGTAYGGTLGDELGEEKAMHYISEVDKILEQHSHGDYPDIYKSNAELKLKCLQNNLQLLDMDVRHLGTDRNLYIMQNLIRATYDIGAVMIDNVTVTSVVFEDGEYAVTYKRYDDYEYTKYAKSVVFAVGRGGSKFFNQFCDDNNIEYHSNAVDIGVRVEMKDAIWDEFSSKIYEPKILHKTKTFEDKTRMFCFNKGGIVSAENNNGIITANGHSYASTEKKTDNCNFAVLTSINFTEPFNKPTVYATNISSLANIIGNGNVIVQRFGDLIRGRRTNEHRLLKNTVKPTLKATAGDLSLVLPHRILTDIIETLYALDNVAPGTANDDTLLYGCESKYYSIKPCMTEQFEIMENAYVVGDCSGICRGLSQSAAMGLYVAENLLKKL